jgi:ribosomal protein L31
MKGVTVFYAILATGLFAFSGLPAHAQTPGGADSVTVNVSPAYPRPYQTVTITPSSTLIDLTASTVTITANGVVVAKGSGSAPAQIQAGGPGSHTNIVVKAVTGDGQTYTAQTTLQPADVSLIVEPISTTHPFYRGAALVASEGRLRVIAIPDLRTSGGAPISASNLVYTWKNGDQILEGSSGIGKSVLVANAPVRFRDADITVTVSTQDNSSVAQAVTTISPVDPIARIYQSDPLLGPLFNYALPQTVVMTDAEDTFRGIPYYFSGTPALSWAVNSTQSETGKDITVRSSGSGTGTAIVGLTAKQGSTDQIADTSMTVQFGASKPLGIFGL